MLKKIDCVLIKTADLDKAAELYESTLGLRRLWRDDRQIGLGMSDTDAEIVLHSDETIPVEVDVNFLVDDVSDAVQRLTQCGYRVIQTAFDTAIGKCAVVQDALGVTWSILDMTKGARTLIQE